MGPSVKGGRREKREVPAKIGRLPTKSNARRKRARFVGKKRDLRENGRFSGKKGSFSGKNVRKILGKYGGNIRTGAKMVGPQKSSCHNGKAEELRGQDRGAKGTKSRS